MRIWGSGIRKYERNASNGTQLLIGSLLVLALAHGCGAPTPAPVAQQSAASTFNDILQYEGSCSWLRCANCNDASGAFGLGCQDGGAFIAIPNAGMFPSGQTLNVCNGASCVIASVWDVSCCNHWEGNKGLMSALGIGTTDGTCNSNVACGKSGRFTHGSGQASVVISTCGNGHCEGVYGESTDTCPQDCPAPPPLPPPPPPPDPPCDLRFGPGDGTTGPCSPIVVDLSGDGFALTSATNGVSFDITGTGRPIQMGWTAAGADDAFLALDRNGNGIIDDGKELFGNFTAQPPSRHPNGFLALAVFDRPDQGGNGDGVIDAHDRVYASLRAWVDLNHDGVSQPDELLPLPSVGIFGLGLSYHHSPRIDQYGNQFRYRATVNPRDRDDQQESKVGPVDYDVFFTALPPPR